MIQLKVYNNILKEEQYWIDLYDTEPIKLTLSIEDITDTDATSTYSKAFKVPGTRTNAEFFKNSFDVDGILFDVTIKKPAEVLVDGAEFKQGHVRLQNVYLNTELDRYDYELIFLGETRDFSSLIGDKKLCELNMSDLLGGERVDPAVITEFTSASVVTSWQAFPQTASLTAGLHDGNIIYPLIDHGNAYDEVTGDVIETRIALENVGGVGNNKRFTDNQHPLTTNRMKPMIRAKRILKQIFDDAGYEWNSDFLESETFAQIYISAFGNEATPSFSAGQSGPNTNNIAYANNQTIPQFPDGLALYFPNNWINPAAPAYGLRNQQSNPYGTVYKMPTTYDAATPYIFTASCYYEGEIEDSSPQSGGPVRIPIPGRLQLVLNPGIGQQVLLTSNTSNGTGGTCIIPPTAIPSGFSQGDVIGLVLTPNQDVEYGTVENIVFHIQEAPGEYNPVASLECTYRQIDFVKDILTAFRLVLSPDPTSPKRFVIEPWQTYINSGDLYDWSKKLVENKDVQFEPVFFSQSDVIDFKFQPGGDYANIYHQQAYQEPYGWLQFSSNNDLLKGKREIKLNGIAPSELLQIEGIGQGTGGNNSINWPVLQLHTHTQEDNGLQHKPIKPKTRMLFYNGLVSTNGATWYLDEGTTVARTVYPLVSPYQDWPITDTSLNLNWSNDIQYWGTHVGYNLNGPTLYDNYWSRYISSLYNKYARRVTAYFILNNIDLNTFSFDDTIFVNGTYYRPEKIIDVEIGAYTEVKVQLLTSNDYKPAWFIEPLSNLSAVGYNTSCGDGLGYITVTTDGTPAFNWSLNNGVSGQQSFAPGTTPPFTWDIPNLAPGLYTLDITDALGRTGTVNVSVPVGTGTPTSTFLAADSSSCSTCGGSVTVTPAGGTAGKQIFWTDIYTSGYGWTRSNMCPGTYTYYIVDTASGCESLQTSFNINCPPVPLYVYEANEYGADCNTLLVNPVIVSSVSPLTVGGSDVYILDSVPGCWAITGTSTYQPTANVVSTSPSCEVCIASQGGIEDWYFFSYGAPTQFYPADSGWVPYTDLTPIPGASQFAFLTEEPQNYYLGDFGTNQTQSLSDAFEYMLQTTGTTPTQTTRWLPVISGFSWNDPNIQSPTVDVCNLNLAGYPDPVFYQFYVAVKESLFNQFFTPVGSINPTQYIGPKMWYEFNNQTYWCSGSGFAGSDLWEYNKLFTLGGEAYRLLINTCDGAYNGGYTIPVTPNNMVPSYLKFSTPPLPLISWKAESCVTPGQYVYVSNGTILTAGTVIKTSGGLCYTLLYETSTTPDQTIVTEYQNCESCAGVTPSVNYDVDYCDLSGSVVASSTITNYVIGSVVKLDNGDCVTIMSISAAIPTLAIDDTQVYQGCETCNPPPPPTCNEYTIGGYDYGCTKYIDCDGIVQIACYNGPAASGYDQETFCATIIVDYYGSQPVNTGLCPF